MKKIHIAIIAVLVLIVASVGLALYLLLRADIVAVPVASHTIRPWNEISAEDITEIYVRSEDIPEGVILDKEEIIGKYTLAATTIYTGSYYFEDMLEDASSLVDGPYRYLADDEVAYDLYIKDVKINAAAISPSMSIDLYLTIKDGDKVYSDLLLGNVYVLGAYSDEGRRIYDRASDAELLTLRVDKEAVNYLNKALVIGDISVIISSDSYTSESSELNTESVLMRYLNDEEDSLDTGA